MGKYRRNRGGGGGGGSGNKWMGFMSIIMGVVALLITLIMYGIALDNLDTAYTTAATYTEQVGLTDVMGIWPLVLFILFMTIGIGAIGVGAYVNVKKGLAGSWMDIFLVVIMGTVTIVIAILMNTTIQGQLHTVYITAANVTETVNIASFSGLLNVMTIFGMVIFLSLMAAGVGPILAAGYGGYKQLAGKM